MLAPKLAPMNDLRLSYPPHWKPVNSFAHAGHRFHWIATSPSSNKSIHAANLGESILRRVLGAVLGECLQIARARGESLVEGIRGADSLKYYSITLPALQSTQQVPSA